ncbi:MAG: PAS domain-containing protein [Sedimentitalea sp.]
MIRHLTGRSKPAKVIDMDKFGSGVNLSPLRQAEAYWSALRNGEDMPRRSQIDPRGLQNILEYTFILERVAPSIARFRLAGAHICAITGFEVRGMPITACFTPSGRNQFSAILKDMFDQPNIAEITLIGQPYGQKSTLEARMILLPMRNDQGDVNRALGVVVAQGPRMARNVPCRFDVQSATQRPVSRGPLQQIKPPEVVPTPAKPVLAPPPPPESAKLETPYALASIPKSVPYLRLVKTDR